MAIKSLGSAIKAFSTKNNTSTPIGSAGFDNPRENIDPHVKTKVVSTREGSVEKTPVLNHDIANKEYVDLAISGARVRISGANYIAISGQNIISAKQVNLTSQVTGTLPVANGGTGKASWTSGGIVYASGTTTLANGSNLYTDGSSVRVRGVVPGLAYSNTFSDNNTSAAANHILTHNNTTTGYGGWTISNGSQWNSHFGRLVLMGKSQSTDYYMPLDSVTNAGLMLIHSQGAYGLAVGSVDSGYPVYLFNDDRVFMKNVSSETKFYTTGVEMMSVNDDDVFFPGHSINTYSDTIVGDLSGDPTTADHDTSGNSYYYNTETRYYMAFAYKDAPDTTRVFSANGYQFNHYISSGDAVDITITAIPADADGIRIFRTDSGYSIIDGQDFTSTGTYLDDGDYGGGIDWDGSITTTGQTSPYSYVSGSKPSEVYISGATLKQKGTWGTLIVGDGSATASTNDGVIINGATRGVIQVNNMNASTDNKKWYFLAETDESFYWGAVNDAEDSGTNYVKIERTGNTVDVFKIMWDSGSDLGTLDVYTDKTISNKPIISKGDITLSGANLILKEGNIEKLTGDLVVSGSNVLIDSNVYGSLWCDDIVAASGAVVIGSSSVYYHAKLPLVRGEYNGFNYSATSGALIATVSGAYKFDWSATLYSATANQKISAVLFVNDTPKPETEGSTKLTTASDEKCVAGSAILRLVPGDVVMFGAENETGTNNIIFTHATLTGLRVGK